MISLQNKSLKELDPLMYELIDEEHKRQVQGLELIASENFTSRGVLEGLCCTFSMFNNDERDALNSPFCTELENLTKKRALKAFNLDPNIWDVNVRPHSGSPANFATLNAILEPSDRIMGLSLQHGGHLTHGHYTNLRKVNCSSYYFESLPYITNSEGIIDYDKLKENAILFRPKLIIAGASGYPREIDFKKFRDICDQVKAYLLVDISHYSGLVVANKYPSPKDYADFITTTSHKTLRGPRSALIFYKKSINSKLNTKIDDSVTGQIQTSAHFNQISALCFQLKQVLSEIWYNYADNVINNSKALCQSLKQYGINILTNGTDSHKVLIDTRSFNISGSKVEKLLDACGISSSRSCLPCDGRTMNSSGVRLGTAALTSRGLKIDDFRFIAQIIMKILLIASEIDIDEKSVDFSLKVKELPNIQQIRRDVIEFASSFEFLTVNEKNY